MVTFMKGDSDEWWWWRIVMTMKKTMMNKVKFVKHRNNLVNEADEFELGRSVVSKNSDNEFNAHNSNSSDEKVIRKGTSKKEIRGLEMK